VRTDRETLQQYEEVSRARYASGAGLEQAVIKLQAEITKDDNRLLDIATRRANVTTSLNALRNVPPLTPVENADLTAPAGKIDSPLDAWRSYALANRPEIRRANAEIEQASTMVELAKKENLPDVTVGLGYTFVGPREDAAGRTMPPDGNGNDILGVTAGMNLPIWRKRIAAGIEEAVQMRSAAEESKVAVVNSIDQSLGDLIQRIELTRKQLDLFQNVLSIQAEQSLRSAEAGYAAGTLNALDLLDSERVLLDVRTSTARTRADYDIAIARLEGTAAVPVTSAQSNGESNHD
ncbi:MAG: TolC family protein, partial [Thermoanaerobaculia bacterium]